MRIIDMVNAKFPNATNYEKPAVNNGFDMFLADAGRRQAERTAERATESATDNRSDDRPRNHERTEGETRRESTRPIRQASHTEEAASAVECTAVVVTEQCAPVEDAYVAEVYEVAVIEKIAEILQVPVEIVKEWLEELNVTVEDLSDPKVVAKVLQLALDAESPAEILTHPEFPENYKAVNEAVAEMQVKTAASTVKPAAITGENTVMLNAEGLENVEAVFEDGEPIAVESKDENSPGNNEQRATTQESTQIEQQSGAPTAEIPTANNLAPEALVHDSPAMTPTVTVETLHLTSGTSATPTPQQPVTASNVIEQIMNQVKLTSAGGQFTEIRVTLRPDSLGDIILRVVTQNGIVMAQFEAESQRVKELLEANFNQLRDALAEQGIAFSELSVSVRQDENERMSQFEKARQAARHRAESVEDVSEQEEVSYHNGVVDVIA
ncbi:MAG: flagellar hook-length control protein FliK [Defluviitaleaceae bacterium]|nr:flagellar hook-length control protein FliK [Defluviitaleaceae bacterium]